MQDARLILFWLALLACSSGFVGCSTTRRVTVQEDPGPPVNGGTLKLVGGSDIDHLAATSGYSNNTILLLRTLTRQLVAYPSSGDWEHATQVAADLAEAVPTHENRGISQDGRTYTFHLRRGVLWDAHPPRE